MEENKPFLDAQLDRQDQRDAEHNSMDVDLGESGNAEGSEERQNGKDLPVQQPDGIAETLSTTSDSSDNESLRSRVPRVNSPEHLVSVYGENFLKAICTGVPVHYYKSCCRDTKICFLDDRKLISVFYLIVILSSVSEQKEKKQASVMISLLQ